jgi:hypothetical protein
MDKPRRSQHARAKDTRHYAPVVDLAEVRRAQRQQAAERRVRAVLDENRAALGRLFSSGLIFTQAGTRNGRDLLGARQSLLKLLDLANRLEESTPLVGDLRAEEREAVRTRLEVQLARTSQLTARTGELLAGRGRD